MAFVDVTTAKDQIRQQVLKPEYNVTDFYADTGLWQKLARSKGFENAKLVVTVIYLIWAAIDADYNDDNDAVVFKGVVVAFTVIFCLDVMIRFLAFKRKNDCLRDAYFLLDLVLAPLVILDAWAPILRFFQCLIRISGFAQAVPEMAILLKGLVIATRSVFFCTCLEILFTYLFGFALVILTQKTSVGDHYFETTVKSMHTLLVHGIFIGEHGELLHELHNKKAIAEVFFVIYILVSWITIAMALGVMCEVVSVVAATEKETLMTKYAVGKCTELMNQLDDNGDGRVSKKACEQVIMMPEFAKTLSELGVDVIAFVDLLDYIFVDDAQLSMEDFIEVILQLRGSNTATVKDIIDFRRFLSKAAEESTVKTKEVVTKPLSDRLAKVEDLLNQLLAKKGNHTNDTNSHDDDSEDV